LDLPTFFAMSAQLKPRLRRALTINSTTSARSTSPSCDPRFSTLAFSRRRRRCDEDGFKSQRLNGYMASDDPDFEKQHASVGSQAL
jgi:hypothetical protein